MRVLTWALHLLIGCGFGLQPHPIWLAPLLASQWLCQRKLQSLAFCCLGIVLAHVRTPPLQQGDHPGRGIFLLQSISPSHSPFSRSLALRGTLTAFETAGICHRNIPCRIFTKKKPEGAHRFYVEGTLKEGRLKLGTRPLQALGSLRSIPYLRFALKERVRSWCHRRQDKKVGHFFASMLTGDVDDRLLAMEFRKWGLSHILAISGFHLTLIALGCGLLFRLTLPAHLQEVALAAILTLALLYFGPSPSTTRAYVMIIFYLLGQKFLRPTEPLELLAIALLLELVMHPQHAMEIGFQLSYGATFGIVAFLTPIDRALQRLFPKRRIETLQQLSFLDKHGYLTLCWLRKGLALSAAAHLPILPILLYHFGSFPLLSLFLNLFMPPLLGLAILCIPFGPLDIAFTRWLLSICSHIPESFNVHMHFSAFPLELTVILITLIGTLGLTLTRKMRHNSVLTPLSHFGDRSSVG